MPKPELAFEIVQTKIAICEYFLRNYDPEIHDGTLSHMIRKLDRLEGEFYRPPTFMGEPLVEK